MADKQQDTLRLRDRDGNTLAYKVRERSGPTARRGWSLLGARTVLSDDLLAVARPIAVLVLLVASIILLLA